MKIRSKEAVMPRVKLSHSLPIHLEAQLTDAPEHEPLYSEQGGVILVGNVTMPMIDILKLAYAALTGINLAGRNDPRHKFVRTVKSMRRVRGFRKLRGGEMVPTSKSRFKADKLMKFD